MVEEEVVLVGVNVGVGSVVGSGIGGGVWIGREAGITNSGSEGIDTVPTLKPAWSIW